MLFFTIGTLLASAERPSSNPTVLTAKKARLLELTAISSADHLSLANYYKEQARKFDDKARYHEDMAEIYRRKPLPFDEKMAVPMQRHCKEWAARFREPAERASVD
jgi:hypothetical protein